MRPLSAFTCVLIVATLLIGARAGAQCEITGPSSLCNGAVQLCGPTGDYMYEWTGPDFFFSTERCITVTTPGTYMLDLFDTINGLEFGPCLHDVSVAPTIATSIEGPSSVCAGSMASLCGPNGSLGYAWSGPDGFASTSQCVSVGTEGTYSLVVTDLASGCTSAPAEHALSVTAAPVASITGSDQTCAGSSVELCGPNGSLGYVWSGPGGFASSSACVTVGTGGTYSLIVTDLASGCASAPAHHDLSVPSSPVASISGPSQICAGSSIELCGPAGNLTYEWSGPAGFTGTTACATVGLDGDYRLVVRDVASGCASAAADHVVALATCQTHVNCPRPASFWTRQCRTGTTQTFGGTADNTEQVTDDVLAAIGASVDDHAAFFSWSNDRDGFCATIRATPRTLAARAARQFAAVWANVSAGDLGLAQFPDRPTALDPTTRIQLPEASSTIGEWLAATDATLASLAQRSPRDRAVMAAYRRIITVGWHVNHGIGIGPVCGRAGSGHGVVSTPSGRTGTLATGVNPAVLLDEEPLAVELADEDRASLMFASIQPNPFAINARIGFTVVSSANENVSIGIYDLSGRLVHELVRGSFAPGAYEVRWDGRDDRGGLARNGMYFVLGRVNGGQVESRVSLLR